MNSKKAVSVSSFYKVYCVPKRNLTSDIDRWFTEDQVKQSLVPIYETLVDKNPAKPEMKEVSLIAFNRLFDARIAMQLNLRKQLEDMLVSKLQSWSFTSNILSNKVNCFLTEQIYDNNVLDYFDIEKSFFLPMDKDVHYFVIPVFVISTNDEVPVSNVMLQPLRDSAVHNEVNKSLVSAPMSRSLKEQINEDPMLVGITDTDELTVKFLTTAKGIMKEIITGKDILR